MLYGDTVLVDTGSRRYFGSVTFGYRGYKRHFLPIVKYIECVEHGSFEHFLGIDSKVREILSTGH